MTKWVKLAVASAMVFGASSAMANNDLECTALGIQDETDICCVKDANDWLVVGAITNISTDEDGNVTMKCSATGVDAKDRAVVSDPDTRGEDCNIPVEYTRTVGKKGEKSFTVEVRLTATDWQNVVSATDNDKGKATKTTNSSLVCEYVPLTPGEDTLSVKSVELK